MNNRNQQENKRRPLTEQEQWFLFAHLLRCPALFQRAKAILKVEDIQQIEYALTWRAVLEVVERNEGQLPVGPQAIPQIKIQAMSLAERITDILPVHANFLFGDGQDSAGFFAEVAAYEDGALTEGYGASLLKLYLEDRLLYGQLEKSARGWKHGLPASVDAFMEQLSKKRTQIASIGVSPVVAVFPDVMTEEPTEMVPTGVSFIDRFMNGGQIPDAGEVYVLLGPTKSGKTTLAVKIAVCGATYQQQHPASDGEMRYWYYFTYESPVQPDIRARIWANHAVIEEDSLRNPATLSSMEKGDYKPYEYKRFASLFKSGEVVPGEKERLEASRQVLQNSNLVLVDFSGSIQGCGGGGIDEIAVFMQQEVEAGRKPLGIVIDYLMVAVDRYVMNLENNTYKNLSYDLMRRYIMELHVKVAAKYKCCAWVIHQFHGDASKKQPFATLHHADALGIRNIADNAWFAFGIGNKTEDSIVSVQCTAQRRAPKMEPAMVFLDGAVRNMESVDNRYSLDPQQQQIVPKNFRAGLVRPDADAKLSSILRTSNFQPDDE